MTLFNLYDRRDRGKALALAKEMKGAKPNEEGWALSLSYEEQMISAERQLSSGNAKGALDLLTEVHLPSFADHAQLDMLRARAAETTGDVAKAYEGLLKIFASEPTDDLQAAITSYGQKLGKTPKQMPLVRTANHSDVPGHHGLGGENAVVDFHGRPPPGWKGLPERRGADFVLIWICVRG